MMWLIVRTRDRKGRPLTRAVTLHNGLLAANEADALSQFVSRVPLYRGDVERGELEAVPAKGEMR